MASSLIRGRYVIPKVISRAEAQVIEDGAVFQRDGTVVEVGTYDDLAARHQPDEVLGSAGHLVIPGLVNGHHHIGLTPVQHGAPDDALEPWLAGLLVARTVDPYLDTLYSAFEMIESGVTTVQHLHGEARGGLPGATRMAEAVIKGYRDIGMRVSYSYGIQVASGPDDDVCRRLPAELGRELAEHLRALRMPLEDHLALFVDLHGRYQASERVRIQLAPTNLHWCSDAALLAIKEHADRERVPMHMHLVETVYQKEYARRRTGTTAVRHLHNLGLLGPGLTLGHGVWMNEDDIRLVAESGTYVCHQASSNLRLRNGVLPLNQLEAVGIRVALGIDEAGMNDDRDMLQELKLVLRLHRTPGMDDAVPTCPQVLRMATQYGAETTPYGDSIGALEPGKGADLVIMNWKQIAYPYLDQDTPIIDAIVQRARSSGVETVLVAGEPILRDGKFTRIDKDAALEELAASLRTPRTPDEERRRRLAHAVPPHLKRFFADYLDLQAQVPFYTPNSRQ
jgi:cytosine/adenosine deaminase-related metal-dependent hydrolase